MKMKVVKVPVIQLEIEVTMSVEETASPAGLVRAHLKEEGIFIHKVIHSGMLPQSPKDYSLKIYRMVVQYEDS